IKATGIYDAVMKILNERGKNVTELAGINPNPRYTQVLAGAEAVRKNDIDLILAVGGGSVIDCSKAISVAAYAEGDPWERFWEREEDVTEKIVPVASVLTMTGTASEMNSGSVITNEEKKLKMGRVFPSFVNPKFSVLNPEFTYTVPKRQMLSGIFDIMSHLMEQYFNGTDDNICDYLIEGLMKGVIASAKAAVINPLDYNARANIMWGSTMALNKIIATSKEQDWEVHAIEHQLGAYTDCPHGEGLAVISLAYYRYIYRYCPERFVRFAKNVWGVDVDGMTVEEACEAGIASMESFVKEMGMPVRLRDLGATEEMLEDIAASTENGGGYKYMEKEDILAVLKNCY
ncbi:MAG: iron-containing alcohol dehydrogenase, partial [Christensenellales bacterium]